MAGLRPHLEHGPETYLAGVNIVGGTFVEPGTGGTAGKVVPCAAGTAASLPLGLAIGDAAAIAGMVAPAQDAWGRYTAGVLTPPNEVAVAYRGSWWIKNTTASPWTFGQRLYLGANGTLTGTANAGPVVGICIDAAGTPVNSEGRVRLTIR